jgi:nitrite reductase/ring-hydroxylating ferredoxin subunit
LAGLAGALTKMGVAIHEDTRVEGVGKGSPRQLTCSSGTVTADAVVLATHSPITKMLSVQSKVAAYRSYVMGVKVKEPVTHALYWDTEDPYHYTRLQKTSDGEIVIIGGADHKTGQSSNAQKHYDQLKQYVTDHFKVADIHYRWSAQVFNSCDGLPYIGQAPLKKNVYVATGFSGNGMTFGTVSGLVISDVILGRANAWAKPLRATRISIKSLFTTYLKENMNIGQQYLRSYLNRGDKTPVADIPLNEGRVLNLDGKKLAVYKDGQGTLTKLSPVCTHAGCTVGWNNAEKTWDCPCHGGRYNPYGKVIVGPPVKDLAAAD